MQFDVSHIVLGIAVGTSVVIWGLLFAHRRRTGHLLPFEPRRPTPWGPFGFLVVCLFVACATAEAIDLWMSGKQGLLPQKTPSTKDFLRAMWAFSAIMLLGMAVVQWWYAWSGTAERRDLGWPDGWKEWLLDLRIGLIAAMAVIGPVYVIQIALVFGLDMPTSHPLVDAFLREPRLSVAITVGFSALVAAPICEELLFRQLTQGWLERLEDGWSNSRYVPKSDDDPLQELPSATNPPRGRWPIYISSFLFALAHLGQGGSPIPLFFLAIALGYLYQHTHRIVPCIVLHMLFNAFAMTLLGLQVALQ